MFKSINWLDSETLYTLKDIWQTIKPSISNPFLNSGYYYVGDKFQIWSYSWDEMTDQDYNLIWRDYKVTWVGYLGRYTESNRSLTDREREEIVEEFQTELES